MLIWHLQGDLGPCGKISSLKKKKSTTCVFSFPYSVVADKQQFFQRTVSESSKIFSIFFPTVKKKENFGLVVHITILLQQHQPAWMGCAGSLACATQREVEGRDRECCPPLSGIGPSTNAPLRLLIYFCITKK